MQAVLGEVLERVVMMEDEDCQCSGNSGVSSSFRPAPKYAMRMIEISLEN